MKIAKGIIAVILGVVAYFVTFTAFWESWFPYYYHEYISYWFLVGLVGLLLTPALVSLAKNLNNSQGIASGYLATYYKSVLGLNTLVVVACFCTFAYMLSHGIFLGGNGATTYSIVPGK